MYSVYDIAYDYIKINCQEADDKLKKEIIKTIAEVLDNGTNGDELYKRIKNGKVNTVEHSRYIKSLKSSGNLIKSGKMLYHNELRIVPEAPMVYFDIDSGEMKKKKQDYFLEIRANYTLDDLVSYIKRKEFLAGCCDNDARVKGALKYLLGKYDVDFLLFLIDTANDILSVKLRHMRNILDIVEYEVEANENYKRRITECAISGSDKIVYKKRELGCVK